MTLVQLNTRVFSSGFGLLAALSLFSTQLLAAEISVIAANTVPGVDSLVQVNVQGDGDTSAISVELYFDESRLELRPLRGVIESAARHEGVYCLRTASNRISILRLIDIDDVLPAQATLCELPFKTPRNAPNGSTSLLLEQAECYAKGLPSECRIGAAGDSESAVSAQSI